jgi:uncharacterized protein (DUF1501 family)
LTVTEERIMRLMGRREFLTTSVLATGGALITSRAVFARTEGTSRFVLVILRGALDGLAAVPPYGDSDYARLRGDLALGVPGAPDGALKLNSLFGLHPSLTFLHDSYQANEALVFHAVASPYRERSHFDGQDVLENGHTKPHAVQTGWLNRALAALPANKTRQPQERGVALGQNIPLVMRGPASVASWSPSRLAALDDDTLERIADLYANDPVLSRRLADALEANAIAMSGSDADGSKVLAQTDKKNARYQEIVDAAGSFLRNEEGPQVAVFDTSGWDTHANEGDAKGQLSTRLRVLDGGLRKLKDQLGPAWRDTAVLIVTEFGRTAAVNGTRGTDHGTGAAAFLLGGAVRGGRVISDWPGLSAKSLYQNRDLKPTLDLRAVVKGVLADHLDVSPRALESSVFPDSGDVRPLRDLIRA